MRHYEEEDEETDRKPANFRRIYPDACCYNCENCEIENEETVLVRWCCQMDDRQSFPYYVFDPHYHICDYFDPLP